MGEQESFAGANQHTNEVALEHVCRLIADLQPGSIVETFVLVTVTGDADDRWLSAFVAPGQKRWETLGLLAHATMLDTNVIYDATGGGEEGVGES